ncbi:hypothetical protein FJT64_023786 [Amphibalanus amphitrite]|uniref:Uncharacterized protein n=1 Tax=Amphibalanus amphitrite TaxID=1232801 RepID=A0A6A4WCN9_AMPAM|nr:hypothetical protein FJT64_023786 [Amphibalanus amphitrite]
MASGGAGPLGPSKPVYPERRKLLGQPSTSSGGHQQAGREQLLGQPSTSSGGHQQAGREKLPGQPSTSSGGHQQSGQEQLLGQPIANGAGHQLVVPPGHEQLQLVSEHQGFLYPTFSGHQKVFYGTFYNCTFN